MSHKRIKISVLLDAQEFQRFDAYCKQQGFKKSTLIARLIRDYLDQGTLEGEQIQSTKQDQDS